MNLVLAVTTFNRLDYLKKCLGSWNVTKYNHKWILIVADDGSTDGTNEFIQSIHPDFHLLNKRRGIHYQTNQILKLCQNIDFDIAFKVDDDVIFKPEWDIKYIEAIQKTGFQHLVFHDLGWIRKKRIRPTVARDLIECQAYNDDLQGAFWTFTNQIIKKVGFFDVKNFGLCGFGHRDYTFRCCKAGFNELNNIFDIKNSNQYLELIRDNYCSAPDRDIIFNLWNSIHAKFKKFKFYNDNRVYVPYMDTSIDLYKKPLKLHI